MFLVFKKAHTDIPHPFPSLCLEREYPQSSNKVAHSAIIQLSMSIAKVAWCHSQLSSQEVSEGATEIWGNWLYSWIWNYKRQCSWFPFPITIWIFVHITVLCIAYQESTNSPQVSLGNDTWHRGCLVPGGAVLLTPSQILHQKMLVNCFNLHVCPRLKTES